MRVQHVGDHRELQRAVQAPGEFGRRLGEEADLSSESPTMRQHGERRSPSDHRQSEIPADGRRGSEHHYGTAAYSSTREIHVDRSRRHADQAAPRRHRPVRGYRRWPDQEDLGFAAHAGDLRR